jgi:hypothetical protein
MSQLATGTQWRNIPDSPLAQGRLFMSASAGGGARVCLTELRTDRGSCCTRKSLSTLVSGVSTVPRRGPAGRPQERARGDPEEPEHYAFDLPRGGIGPKLQMMTNGAGLTFALMPNPVSPPELVAFERTLENVRLPSLRGCPGTRPKHLAVDKACSYRGRVRLLASARSLACVPAPQGRQAGQGRPEYLRS